MPINHNIFEEKGEPKLGRSQTCVLPLTNRAPYHQARPAQESAMNKVAVVLQPDSVVIHHTGSGDYLPVVLGPCYSSRFLERGHAFAKA